MPKNLNKAIIIGNIGKDPETRFMADGSSCTSFPVAANRRFVKKDGEEIDEVEWFNVVTWNSLAEICRKYCFKGMVVYVEGRIHLYRWVSKGMSDLSNIEIIANSIIFLSNNKDISNPDVDVAENDVDVPF